MDQPPRFLPERLIEIGGRVYNIQLKSEISTAE
jgi:hypothetical protein